MKQIEFKTSKGTFIISDEKYYLINENGVKTAYLKDVPQFEYEKFMHLPRLTEEQARNIVDEFKYHPTLIKKVFIDYLNADFYINTAIESLHSLIKSLGVHLYKNPYKEAYNKELSENENNDIESYKKDLLKSYTFYNPYIFKIQ